MAFIEHVESSPWSGLSVKEGKIKAERSAKESFQQGTKVFYHSKAEYVECHISIRVPRGSL